MRWSDPKPTGLDTVAADFSSAGFATALKQLTEDGHVAEAEGDTAAAFSRAAKVIEVDYRAPYLAHAQLEPPSAVARFNSDDTLEVWVPNQMPEASQAVSAKVAIEVRTVGKGPIGRYFSALTQTPINPSVVEGIVEKPYAIPNRHMTFTKVAHPVTIAFWRSVRHSMNDRFYESFLDEIAAAGGQNALALWTRLLKSRSRHLKLLQEVTDLAGGWKIGSYDADDGKRARGISMASPFGSKTATIAEVSVADGRGSGA